MFIRKNIIAKVAFDGIHPRLGGLNPIPESLLLRFGPKVAIRDVGKEELVESNSKVGNFPQTDWYWNSGTEEFQQTAP